MRNALLYLVTVKYLR